MTKFGFHIPQTTTDYLKSFASLLIGGGAAELSAVYTSPTSFLPLGAHFHNIVEVFLGGAIFAALGYHKVSAFSPSAPAPVPAPAPTSTSTPSK